MKKSYYLLILFTLFFCSQGIFAQGHPPHHGHPPGPHGPKDPMRASFYPPEMIMRHQSELKLSDVQRKSIINSMQEAQKNFTDWQWTLEAEMEKMANLLKSEKVAESSALEQLEKVLALEKKIKTAQLKLMIQVKNQLTKEQQTILNKIKRERSSMQPKGPKKGPHKK